MSAVLLAGGAAIVVAVMAGRVAILGLRSGGPRIAAAVLGVWLMAGGATLAVFDSGIFSTASGSADGGKPAALAPIRSVLIAGDDAEADAVVRGTVPYDRIVVALAAELQRTGLTVVREPPPPPGPADDARPKRTDTELLQSARHLARPVDAIVVLALGVPVDSTMQTQNAGVRLTGRVIRAADGRSVGTFQWSSPSRVSIPYACNRPCVVEQMTTDAQAIAVTLNNAIADVLREQR